MCTTYTSAVMNYRQHKPEIGTTRHDKVHSSHSFWGVFHFGVLGLTLKWRLLACLTDCFESLLTPLSSPVSQTADAIGPTITRDALSSASTRHHLSLFCVHSCRSLQIRVVFPPDMDNKKKGVMTITGRRGQTSRAATGNLCCCNVYVRGFIHGPSAKNLWKG